MQLSAADARGNCSNVNEPLPMQALKYWLKIIQKRLIRKDTCKIWTRDVLLLRQPDNRCAVRFLFTLLVPRVISGYGAVGRAVASVARI